ncbi:MAG: peptide deformylase [Solirubrobacterales bacterium]
MAVYKIVEIGDPILKEKAVKVREINDRITALLDNMVETMHSNDGVGLAAPQIGVSKRIIVVHVEDTLLELVNPEIIEGEGEADGIEGCLSVPGVRGKVKRMEKITVTGLNRDGEAVSHDVEGMLARVVQHEVDHLDGVLFVDRAYWTARER